MAAIELATIEPADALDPATDSAPPQTLRALVQAAATLRTQVAATSADIDLQGRDPTAEMQLAADAGLNRISLPTAYGGLSDGTVSFGCESLIKIMVDLAAGDGSVGQNWGTNQLVTREIFDAHSGLPESTLRELAPQILVGARLVASNAETGGKGAVTLTPAPGGLTLNGTKTFNTNSGGGGYANVGSKLDGKPHHAIVPLDAPGVTRHGDWDNMGQRGTFSQTVTYDNVFVPDGWHYAGHFPPADPRFFPFVILMHSALMLGIGRGAFDATLAHLRKNSRVIMPEYKTAIEDPIVRLHLGDISIKLRAAEALLLDVARRVEDPSDTDVMDIGMDAFRVKVACVQASLAAGERIFELTGARSTANKNRFDRFWRNARVFSVHDTTDSKTVWVGGWELERQPPSMFANLRV